MNKLTYIFWAFVAGVLNNYVLTTTSPAAEPLSFRRGTDDIKLVHCDTNKPGFATVELPDGNRDTSLLAEGEWGQLVTNYGRATGQQIELAPVMGFGEEKATAAGAGGEYDSRIHP